VASWSIDMPHIDEAVRFRDCFGNMSHLVVIPELHNEVTIAARGIVETEDRTGFTKGLIEVAPARVYKRQTPRTAPDDAIRALSAETAADDPIGHMHNLMDAINGRVQYVIGATNSQTGAAEALKNGQGVCQDHAHIFISAVRVLGLPARYVNGYFLTEADEVAEAHHAWAEVWIEGLGWIGFDSTNRMCPTDRYVRLACGLDAGSAAPIRGTRRGGSEEVLDVTVEVQQQSNAQQ
jgi:transglutaminase-like putative cysteine protease